MNEIVFYMGVLWRNIGGDGHPVACRGGEERRHVVSPCSSPGARWGDHLMLQRLVVLLPLSGRGGKGRKKNTLPHYRLGGRRCGGADAASCRREISMTWSPPMTLADGQPFQCFGNFSSSTHRRQVSVQLLNSTAVGQHLPS
jgi:hypothetical protein